jgi:acyl carrier protein
MSNRTIDAVRASLEVENVLLSIVRELLHNKDIQPEDDFFLAGGYSLLGTQLVIRARKAFGVKLALHDLFDAGTVVRLACRVEELVMQELDSLSDEEAVYAIQEGQA